MTIQEAIKSSKKFRRRSWAENNFLVYDAFDQRLVFYSGGVMETMDDKLSPLEVLAEDWETIEDGHELNIRQQIARDITRNVIEKSIKK